MNLLQIKQEKCTRCYACMRTCPVKAIHYYKTDDRLEILPDACIACGSCYLQCPEEAIAYVDSTEKVKRLLDGDKPVFAVCDTDISAEFTDISDYRKFVSMIKALGFKKVFSSALAVDAVAAQYKKLLREEFKGKYYLSSNCPVVVNLVEKYYPHLIGNLAPILSPDIVAAKMLRQAFHKTEIALVYISPCLAQKGAQLRDNDHTRYDAVLLFPELRRLFLEKNIQERQMEFSDFDGMEGRKGLLYPISNGILQAGEVSEDLLEGNIRTTNGKQNVMKAISSFDMENERLHSHLNLFFCEGCVMGPGTQHDHTNKFVRSANVIDYAKKRLQHFDADFWQSEFDDYKNLSLEARFFAQKTENKVVSENEVNEIHRNELYQSQGMTHSCGYCGFPNCRELAKHIAKGTATRDLCVRQTVINERRYAHFIKEADEKIAHLSSELENNQGRIDDAHFLTFQAKESLSRIINQLSAGIIIIDIDGKIVEANESLINILGEEAAAIAEVIPGLAGAKLESVVDKKIKNFFDFVVQTNENIDRKEVNINGTPLSLSVFNIMENRLLGGLFRQTRNAVFDTDEMILHIQRTIDKHLTMVQEIGFILGEGASHTEKDLNQMINTLKQES